MAQNQNIPASTNEMKNFNKEAASITVTLKDLAKAINDNAKAASKFTGDSAAAYKESFSGALDLAKQLQGITEKDIKTKETQESLAKRITAVERERVLIQSKISYLQDKLLTAKGREADLVKKSLEQLQDADDTIGETLDKAKSLTNEYKEQGKAAKAQIDSWKKVSLAFATSTILKGLASADQRVTDIRRGLNASRADSQKMAQNFADAAQGMSGLSADDLQKSALGLSSALGTVGVVSAQTASEMATQVKFMGMSTEEANKLAEYTEATGQDAKDLGNTIRGEVILSNKRNKTAVDYKAILKDVANTSNATKLLMKSQGNNLASATIEAKKLGTTMEGIANISKSMLNFEDSIASELEAELLTGKELNNEKARMYALTGNQEGLAKEITKNQVLQKFEAAKTVLEQDAIAKAYGMSSETMADMVVQSKALASFGAKTKTELNANYQKRLQEVEAMQDGAEKEKARAKLTKDIGGEAAEQQQKAMTLAENQALVFEKLAGAMTALAPILEPLKAVLQFIGHHAKIATAALLVIGSVGFASQVGKVVGNLSNLGGIFSKLKMPSMGGAAGGGGGAGGGGMIESFSKINTTSLLKGAAAMLVAAGAIWVFGKGVQELDKVKDWGKVAIGLGLFAASMGVMAVIATLAAGPLYVMAPAMIAFGAAVALMGLGLNLAAPGIEAFGKVISAAFNGLSTLVTSVADAFVKMLGSITTDKLAGLLLLGPALLSIAAGLGAVAIAGALAIPAIAGMTIMSIVAPKIVDLAETLGMSQKGESKGSAKGGKEGASMEAVVEKLDQLIIAVKQGHNIYIGANKLNEAIGLNAHPLK